MRRAKMGLVKTSLDDLTYKVNGLAMLAQRELKVGHRERVYQYRLADLIAGERLQVEVEKKVEVYINELLVGYMYIDLWVEQSLVVECKAHSHSLTKEDYGQGINYFAGDGAP